MNFEILDHKRFKIDNNTFHRLYKIRIRPNGKITIYNAKDGSVLKDNIDLNSLKIQGVRLVNIEDLEKITFVSDCYSSPTITPTTPIKTKIFDRTFDNTFE